MKRLLLQTTRLNTLAEQHILNEKITDTTNITAEQLVKLEIIQKALQTFFEKNLAILESDRADTLVRDPLVQHYTETVTATKKLATEIAIATDSAIVGSKFKEYVQTLKDYFSITTAAFATNSIELNKILNDFLAMSQKGALTAQDVAVIKEQVAMIQPLLTQIDDDNSALFATATGVFTSVLTIVYGAKTALNVMKSSTAEPFTDMVEKAIPDFIKAMEILDREVLIFSRATGNNKKQFSKLVEKSKTFRDNWLNFSKTYFDSRAAKKAETKIAATIDWDEKFKQATDKTIFWKEYFEKVWGSSAQKVAALGDAFKQECEKLGFTEKSNPFILFIKKCILERNYTIPRSAYDVIHNMAADGSLSRSDIAGIGKLKFNNVIFAKDLYTKTPAEISDYIDLQNEISMNAGKLRILDTATLNKEATSIAKKIRGADEMNIVYWFLFVDLVATGALQGPGNLQDSKLNRYATIRGWLTECLGFDNSSRTKIVDATAVADLVNKILKNNIAGDGEITVYALASLMTNKDNAKKIRGMIQLKTLVDANFLTRVVDRTVELRNMGYIDFDTAKNIVDALVTNNVVAKKP